MTGFTNQAHPASRQPADSARSDAIAVGLAICVLLLIAFLSSVLPGVPG